MICSHSIKRIVWNIYCSKHFETKQIILFQCYCHCFDRFIWELVVLERTRLLVTWCWTVQVHIFCLFKSTKAPPQHPKSIFMLLRDPSSLFTLNLIYFLNFTVVVFIHSKISYLCNFFVYQFDFAWLMKRNLCLFDHTVNPSHLITVVLSTS